MKWMALPGLLAINMVAHDGGVFDQQAAVRERLRRAPGAEARQELATTATTPPPSRWTLRTIRTTLPWLQSYMLSGVWRLLRRCRLKLRSARVQHYSPDPEYTAKVARLEQCLQAVAAAPEQVVVICMDQMGFTRWPEAATTWAETTPVAERSGPTINNGGLLVA